MAQDRFTEVTHESWFSRIGGAIKGVVVGILLVAVAFPLLFWNEGRSVKRYKTLKEGGGSVVSVGSERVDPANEGRLVHVTGRADTQATLTDAAFGVSSPAIKFRRSVEMYQWDEHAQSKTKEKLGGGTETVTTYTYSKTWSGRPIRSDGFKHPEGHQNPGTFPYESEVQTADHVTLGAFTLSPALVGKIGNFEALSVSAESAQPELPAKAKPYGGGFYLGADPASPQLGDVRVTFQVVRPGDVSVIAKQAGQTFAPFVAQAGGTIELLQAGVCTAEAMIQKAQQDNRVLTWLIRLGGFLVMLIGLNLVFKPLPVLASVLPFLGRVVAAGTGLVAFLLAAACSLCTIAVAWIAYRPILGALLLAAAVLLLVAFRKRLKPGAGAS